MTIQWTEEWAVGEPTIDEQHRELVGHINALLEAVGRARSRAEIANMMAFLEVYVLRHFQDEERLMAMVEYPQLEAHRTMHESFARVFARLREEYARDGPTPGLSAELNVRVSGWLVSHIGRLDRAFGEFLAGIGEPGDMHAGGPGTPYRSAAEVTRQSSRARRFGMA